MQAVYQLTPGCAPFPTERPITSAARALLGMGMQLPEEGDQQLRGVPCPPVLRLPTRPAIPYNRFVSVSGGESRMADKKSAATAEKKITSRAEDYSQWYLDIV